jgi:hypothetical protein
MKTEKERRTELEKMSVYELRNLCQSLESEAKNAGNTKALEIEALICWIIAAENQKGEISG